MPASRSIRAVAAQWLKTITGVVGEATLALPKTTGCSRAAAAAGTASISAISSANCSRCRALSGGDMVSGRPQRRRSAPARLGSGGAGGRSRNPGADHRRSRRAARRRGTDGRVEVAITPTYSGCPAMNMIALEIELALERAGIAQPTVRTVLSPAWTTDWMSEDGRRKLREYGIAPPQAANSRRALFGEQQVACPQCGSQKPNCCPSSARPPARRCGAARAAASPSIISSVIEAVIHAVIASEAKQSRAAKKAWIARRFALAMT